VLQVHLWTGFGLDLHVLVISLSGHVLVFRVSAPQPQQGRPTAADILITVYSGTLPAGWSGGPAGTVSVAGAIVNNGRRSARLERTAASPQAVLDAHQDHPCGLRRNDDRVARLPAQRDRQREDLKYSMPF
jgi:hypothetical protein